MMNLVRHLLLTSMVAVLAACGGGGGSDAVPVSSGGTAPDIMAVHPATLSVEGGTAQISGAGFEGATLFVDGVETEPSVRTDSTMVFEIPDYSATATTSIPVSLLRGSRSDSVDLALEGGYSTAEAVTVGDDHACLLDAGAVKCWGIGRNGQLGNGTSFGSAFSASPAQVTDIDGTTLSATAVDAGLAHTCAIVSSGAVYCWGYNIYGAVGVADSSCNNSTRCTTPVQVTGIDGTAGNKAVAISAGDNLSCAIMDDDSVRCWGRNDQGQLGVASSGAADERYTPQEVATLDGSVSVAGIAAGEKHACALLESGAVQCWGDNQNRQLGNTGSDSSTPVDVTDIDGLTPASSATQIAAGDAFTCVRTESAEARCWGLNGGSQLGDSSVTDYTSAAATTVEGLSGVSAVMAGEQHACALLSSGTARCWGVAGWGGVLGNGIGSGTFPSPVAVEGFDGSDAARTITALSGRADATCALNDTGRIYCWGQARDYLMGYEAEDGTSYPAAVIGPDADVAQISGHSFSACATYTDGTARCWGDTNSDGTGQALSNYEPAVVGTLADVVNVAAGEYHGCAANGAGNVSCWGSNGELQLGREGSASNDPTAVAGISDVVQLAAGSYATCARKTDGSVWCWGQADYLGTDIGGDSASATPVQVDGISTAMDITAGLYHFCALLESGELRCWGEGGEGELGNGTVSSVTPLQAGGFDGVSKIATDVSAGEAFTCAAVDDGTVECWGINNSGQFGEDVSPGGPTPVTVPGIDGLGVKAVSLASGTGHSCALTGSGAVYCFGDSSYGAHGTGDVTATLAAQPHAGIDGRSASATELMAGFGYSCALLDTGNVLCWGYNVYNTVGTPFASTRLPLRPVSAP